jgi:hypothetical protein
MGPEESQRQRSCELEQHWDTPWDTDRVSRRSLDELGVLRCAIHAGQCVLGVLRGVSS